ncbi:MAG: hypothetical protein ABIS86_14115 [Streptosporangiaceae bacterium]
MTNGFRIGAYAVFALFLAFILAVLGAFLLLLEDRNRVWWYALVEGVLTLAGWVLSRVDGLPFTAPQADGNWFQEIGLALAFCGTALSGLAIWVLWIRRLRAQETVVSARQRILTR